jgi:thymidylate synthase
MEFKALYFDDKLLKINPNGVIGVVTLWSKPEYVMERFRQAEVDLDPATSPIAVFGTLYGNGLRELLRNLLYNPQIQVLLICGHDRSGSKQELLNFFDENEGLEIVEDAPIYFLAEKGMVTNPFRIKGTNRLIDGLVVPELFLNVGMKLETLGDPGQETTLKNIRGFFEKWRRPVNPPSGERREEPLLSVETEYFPSNPRGHMVVQENPLEAWLDLLHLISRFGRRVILKKGERLELQNVKVVVEEPKRASREDLLNINLDPDKLDHYFQNFLQAR